MRILLNITFTAVTISYASIIGGQAKMERLSQKSSAYLNRSFYNASILDKYLDDLAQGRMSSCSSPQNTASLPLYAKMCMELSTFPSSDYPPYPFQSGAEFSICTAKGLPYQTYSYTELDICGDIELDRGIAGHTPMSKADMEKSGFVYASNSEIQVYASQLEREQLQAAKDCCGEDPVCLEAMKEVQLLFCDSDTSGTASRSAPDPCSDGGYFTFSDLENRKLFDDEAFRSTLSWSKSEEEESSSMWEKVTGEMELVWDDSHGNMIMDLLLDRPSWPYSGRIVLSKYKLKGSATSNQSSWFDDPFTFRHELGHACSSIKKQLRIKSNTTFLAKEDAAIGLIGSGFDCSMGPSQLRESERLFSSVGASTQLSSCLMLVARQSYEDDGPLPSCSDHACAGAYLEEAFAEVFALTGGADELETGSVSDFMCAGMRDSLHPHSHDIAQCLIQYDDRFLKKLKSKFQCRK